MAKDKYDFIQDVLESEKLNSAQRERVLSLTLQEFKSENNKDEERLKRIEEIEERLKTLKSNNDDIYGDSERVNEETNKQSKKHKPKETKELLSRFSSTDGGMKNLTHAFNSGFITYEDLMKKCKEEYKQGIEEYPNAPTALLARIEQFAFSNNPDWYYMKGEKKIKNSFGWSESRFIKWYKENKIHPARDGFYNAKMIIPFKETIQVRADSGNFIRLISELVEQSGLNAKNDFNVTINESVHKAQFFTDVDRLGLAIYHIFIVIKQIADKNFCDKVEINYKIQEELKIVEIIHWGSKSNKSVNDFDFIGGDISNVKSQLWGLCNYDIEAEFPEGVYRKVILSDKYAEIEKIKTMDKRPKYIGKNYPITAKKVKGFTHRLKFY